MKEKTFTVKYAENGYILDMNTSNIIYIYTDEIEMLETIKDFLELEHGCGIKIERKEK